MTTTSHHRDGPDVARLSRRAWCTTVAAQLVGAAAMSSLLARAAWAGTNVVVYKDPSCRCCVQWVKHLRDSGLRAAAHDRSDMDALKDSLGIPHALRSCHTAVIGRYLIEGHVPAVDIRRLLRERTARVTGLAVPGMPAGSPGMEMGGRTDRYDVMAFGADGAAHVYSRHG